MGVVPLCTIVVCRRRAVIRQANVADKKQMTENGVEFLPLPLLYCFRRETQLSVRAAVGSRQIRS